MTDKESVRRRLVGGGVVSIGMLALLLVVVGAPATVPEAIPFAWFGVGGLALLVAGRRERVSLGGTSVGWPRVAGVGLAVLALGSSVLGFAYLLVAPDAWSLLRAALALLVGLLLSFGALECLLGGVGLDEETFAVE
ncbi:hypothetical protein [Halopiger goleimassiliensis]|uniref:hypothetical protein n=1 Tax=Halopiger goleimassiliensis TaxID=1293048 RepID=UPI0006782290|nr:hypothetical protein [Halopiger goleimassiliensis]